MATIYRFIVEQKGSSVSSSGRKSNKGRGGKKKGAAKKGRMVSIIGGEKGGVEHNRRMRAINPSINKAVGGAWEKSMRVGRAGLGLVQMNTATGALGISGTAVSIIVAFLLEMVRQTQQLHIQIAENQNTQNYKQLENGFGAVHGQYELDVNLWDGRVNYNENK